MGGGGGQRCKNKHNPHPPPPPPSPFSDGWQPGLECAFSESMIVLRETEQLVNLHEWKFLNFYTGIKLYSLLFCSFGYLSLDFIPYHTYKCPTSQNCIAASMIMGECKLQWTYSNDWAFWLNKGPCFGTLIHICLYKPLLCLINIYCFVLFWGFPFISLANDKFLLLSNRVILLPEYKPKFIRKLTLMKNIL